ncbi:MULTISPECIES: TonB-dependent receptor [Niastella]|uniref:TonB-dependent receptor n=1 Tax=Niastella soli TaxID=2821487 RepID=A0ABS3Z4F9_9BACT|nr:TonB-dependent receptor [Niastella soli]MBO9205036.1 TonB-dependent receptor [Niastella soli]
MRNFMAILLTLLLLGSGIGSGYSQVTTSSMTGAVKSSKGEPLVGATVVLRHEPTGSVFQTITRTGGVFDLNNLPPGGPYNVTITYVGYAAYKKGDINIPLGEKFDLQTDMSDKEMTSVVVTAGRKGVTEKTGASTNISNRLVQNMPNVSRSLTNLTRATPQSNGTSFAGMNNRFNNITIDGSLFNNNFGRSGDGLVPGGATSAISIDAIDQVQVNIAPYDVRQTGFVGGGINAVTRRGTNNWYGTVYGYYRNQEFNGKKVKGTEVPNSNRSTKIYGASVGGPIIKDKLFFFANFESEKRTQPGQTYVAKKDGVTDPNATSVLASDLDALRTYIINKYNFDPGSYQGYNFETDNKKFLARVDWNITTKHRLTLRYTTSETNDDDLVNASSVTGINGVQGLNNSRRGGSNGGMAYTGTNFKNNVKVWSGVAELNSTFNSSWSNQLIASYTSNNLVRVPNVNVPFVDIMKSPTINEVYISFGTDLFSYRNEIEDKAFNIANNVTYNLGRHTFTGGISFDAMKFANSFTSAAGPAYYRYADLNSFLNNQTPLIYALAYDPTNPSGIKVPEAKFSQLGFYIQDLFAVTPKLKVTYGLRVDLPMYPYTPPSNPELAKQVFKDPNGVDEQFDVSKWPDQKPLWSPRLGFTYDVKGDKSLVVRGGTGIFTGRIPFIWLVNQVGDDGVIRALYQPASGSTELNNITYSTDRNAYLPPNPAPVGTSIPNGSSYSAAAKNFRMPQVWRSNLAVDKRFANSYTATFEAIYTKQINNVYFRNANLGPESGTLANGADKRPIFNNVAAARPVPLVNQMIVMDNISKGYSLSLTAQLQKSFSEHWEAGLAYTYTLAKEVAIGSSDQSASGFNTNNITFNPNKPDMGYSNYSIPHRIVANGSYRLEYADKKMATTFSIFYTAQPQERYTFRYANDINGDGQRNDVMYIPKDPSEISFVEGATLGGVKYTAQQQSDAFFKFIENDKYLKDHKGEYMNKYGATLPWNHSLDLRVLQDFIYRSGTTKHTLQVSVDVINLLNLLNSQWGYRYSYTFGTFQDMGILGTQSPFVQSAPKFTFDPAGPTKAYQPNYSTTSTWGIQLGLRYIFN